MEKKLLDFYTEFNDDIIQYRKNHEKVTANYAFKDVFISYLVEKEVGALDDMNFVEFKKDSDNMRLDGYVFNEYFHSLTLLVCKYQSKLEPEKLGKKEIDKYFKKAIKFLKTCNTNYFEDLEPTSDGYQAYEVIKNNLNNVETIKIVFVTNDCAINYIPDKTKYKGININFDLYDIERLQHIVFSIDMDYKPTIIRLKNKYHTELSMLKVQDENNIYDCYVGIISGNLLANIYKDEGQDLIQKNVRSYLQATGKVNKGIRHSLINEPEMFMAYNNGISTIADSIVIDEDKSNDLTVLIKEITGWQIVNGGQTTASIYNALQNKYDLSHVYIQVKLSVINNSEKSSEIAANISKYANSQNKINMSDFNVNDEYHIQMENISRRVYIPVEQGKETDQWFYERARGQYLVELKRQPTPKAQRDFKERIPKKRCISKTVAAKCLMAYMGYPYYVSKGLESNFIYFSDMIKKGEIESPTVQSFIDMIDKVIMFQQCDNVVASLNFAGYKAQINYYVMALLGEFYKDLYDSKYIWQHQSVSSQMLVIMEKLALMVWEHFQHPLIPGTNITQWCKKEECWVVLKQRFINKEL